MGEVVGVEDGGIERLHRNEQTASGRRPTDVGVVSTSLDRPSDGGILVEHLHSRGYILSGRREKDARGQIHQVRIRHGPVSLRRLVVIIIEGRICREAIVGDL